MKSIKNLVIRHAALRYAFCLFGFTCWGMSPAASFQNWEQTAYGTGDYHAGAAAEATDPSLEFYNPAQVTALHHQAISAGGVIIPADVKFDGTIDGLPSPGFVSSITFNTIPNFHYLAPLSQKWYFAFGVTTPFGLETDYPNNYPDSVSFAATETRLLTININPNLAYAVTDWLSVAAGFDALYGQATYNNSLEIFDIGPFKNHLSAWAYGYNLGVFLAITNSTHLGASYRSRIDLHAHGDSTNNGNETTVRAKFPLPGTAIFSVFQQILPSWSMMASAFYTRWSVFSDLLLKNTALFKIIPVAENYRDTWNFALGTKIKVLHHLTLELGTGYDQTPTRIGYRDIRLPDADHYVLSTGLLWAPIKALSIDFGYTHLFMPTTTIDNSASNAQSNNEVPLQIGHEKSRINVFGLQVTWTI